MLELWDFDAVKAGIVRAGTPMRECLMPTMDEAGDEAVAKI
jgi:hypothetical protein